MKLLLTSGGVSNPTIRAALEAMLPRPIGECRALAIPSAQWGHQMCGPSSLYNFVRDERGAMTGLGWGEVGVLELTALPGISRDRWLPWVEEADVLLVDGGDAAYLCHWLRETGFDELVSAYPDKVWVGMSAGSMVLTPRIGQDFMSWQPGGDDRTLGVVDFSIFPHLDHPMMPDNNLDTAHAWAEEVGTPAYAIDDDSAISVVDGVVEVVSEGQWHDLDDQGS